MLMEIGISGKRFGRFGGRFRSWKAWDALQQHLLLLQTFLCWDFLLFLTPVQNDEDNSEEKEEDREKASNNSKEHLDGEDSFLRFFRLEIGLEEGLARRMWFSRGTFLLVFFELPLGTKLPLWQILRAKIFVILIRKPLAGKSFLLTTDAFMQRRTTFLT